MPSKLPTDPSAERNLTTFRAWQNARSDWDTDARADLDFFLGNQYTETESDDLQSMGQGDFIIDRIYPAIEKLKSMITSRPPRFNAIGREDSDNRLANVWRTILEYVWDISDGDLHFKQAVHDFAVVGKGYFYVYLDREADWGRGEVKFRSVDPFRVYVDPDSRDRFEEDAAGKVLSTILAKDQVLNLFPQLKGKIDSISTVADEEDFPASQQKNMVSSYTPADVKDKDQLEMERYRILEFFEKVQVPYYRLKYKGQERILDEKGWKEFSKKFSQAVKAGLVQHRRILQTRIKVTATIGQIELYQAILNTDIYPIIPVPNIWTGTPYPKSDISKTKDSQRLLNKVFSLVLAHAQASAGSKLLLPDGSVENVEQFQRDWTNPYAVNIYDPNFGEPHVVQTTPLSAEFFNLISRIEHYIDLSFGVPELLHGFKDAAPDTVRGTAMLSQFGEGRGKSKLRDVEMSLVKLGRVVYNYVRGHYTFEKTFRIVQPNNDINEFTINQKIYSDKTQEIAAIKNDISIGQFDIRIVSGSTLPSQKEMEQKLYMEAYQMGLIPRREALKKMEIFNVSDILQWWDENAQLKQYIQQLEQQLKALGGDAQTLQRESRHSREKAELEKFKTRLNEIVSNAKANKKIEVSQIQNLVKGFELDLKNQLPPKNGG